MNAEAALISAVCKNKDISAILTSNADEMFVAYGDVWRGLKGYYHQFRSVPDASVLQEKFPDFVPVDVNAVTGYYVDALKESYIRDKVSSVLLKAGTDLKNDSATRVLDDLATQVTKLSKFSSKARDLDVTDFKDAEEYFETVRERSLAMGGSPGIPTGFKAIDAAYHTGMAPGHLIVVIGWPGRAKTWIATAKIAANVFESGYKPMIVSLEMSPETLRDRIYTTMGKGLFTMRGLARGDIDMDNYRTWAKKYFSDRNGFVVVSNEGVGDVTPMSIQGKIDQHRPDVVIVDYHQLLSDNKRSASEVERQRNISRELKLLAVRNEIPIIDITAATMGDISDQDAPPMLSQVAWAKSIEYDADHSFAVHRYPDTGMIEIVCRKNRHGDLYDFMVEADLNSGVFTEVYE